MNSFSINPLPKSRCILAGLFLSATVAAAAAGTDGDTASDYTAFPQNAPLYSGQYTADSIPRGWQLDRQFSQTIPSDDAWWRTFDDPLLVSLIRRGEEHSNNISSLAHRIEMARISWESAKAAYYPTFSAAAGWERTQQAGKVSGAAASPVSSFFSLGLSMNWEIDVFGRIARQRNAGKAAYEVSKAQYTAAMVALAGNIAKAYFNLRSVQAQILSTQAAIASQEKIQAMTETRYEVGLVSKLDVAQARTVVYSSQATLPSLEALEKSAINTLAMLTGTFPDEIADSLLQPGDMPNPFQLVQTGVPADMLRRRPDIIEAEYELAGYAAQIGIAKSDFLPTLSLTGSIATEARRLDGLFSKHSLSYSVAPQLSWTIFDGMARNYKVAEAKEQMLAGIDSYNDIVLQAYTETQTALDNYSAYLQRIGMLQKVNDQCDETLHLAIDRYKQGLTAFTDVANAQISSLQYINSMIEARANALSALVDIYTALGGNPNAQ